MSQNNESYLNISDTFIQGFPLGKVDVFAALLCYSTQFLLTMVYSLSFSDSSLCWPSWDHKLNLGWFVDIVDGRWIIVFVISIAWFLGVWWDNNGCHRLPALLQFRGGTNIAGIHPFSVVSDTGTCWLWTGEFWNTRWQTFEQCGSWFEPVIRK